MIAEQSLAVARVQGRLTPCIRMVDHWNGGTEPALFLEAVPSAGQAMGSRDPVPFKLIAGAAEKDALREPDAAHITYIGPCSGLRPADEAVIARECCGGSPDATVVRAVLHGRIFYLQVLPEPRGSAVLVPKTVEV